MNRSGRNFQSGRQSIGADTAYRKVRKLGEGGMAETYLCVRREPGEPGDHRTRKTTIEDRLCCKRLHHYRDERPEFRADLEREAAIVAALRHSNIIQLKDWDLVARELYFELVEGCDLRQVLTEVPGRKLAAPVVTLIGLEICKALAYAHSRTRRGKPAGIVHRDISPSNIMISYAGEVKLADFGLAVVVALEQRDGEPLSGIARGKLPYMAPEQAKGDPFADHRVDLFSLGVVLFELLAGRRPAIGSDDEVFAALSTGQHPPLHELAPEVPELLEQVVERLLQPNPAQRYQRADDVIDVLTALTPPANLFRELGALASVAKPPETLTFAAYSDEFEDEVSYDTSVSGVGALRPTGELEAAAAARLESATPRPPEPDTEEVSVARMQQQGPARRRPLARWFGGASALSTVGAALAIGFSGRGELDRGAEPSAALLASAAPAPSVPPDSTRTASRADGTEGLAEAARPEVAPEPPAAPPSLTAEPPKSARSQLASASLRVGVVPIAQVWVDGRYLGWSWSPINIKLKPDVEHTVAAGEHHAEITQSVRLAPGERRELTLHLPPQ